MPFCDMQYFFLDSWQYYFKLCKEMASHLFCNGFKLGIKLNAHLNV